MIPKPTYEELKQIYIEFKRDLPKKTYGELTRWLEEFRITTGLLEFAKKYNLEQDIVEFQQARDIASKELKKLGLK